MSSIKALAKEFEFVKSSIDGFVIRTDGLGEDKEFVSENLMVLGIDGVLSSDARLACFVNEDLGKGIGDLTVVMISK